jgi:hypothetical protein
MEIGLMFCSMAAHGILQYHENQRIKSFLFKKYLNKKGQRSIGNLKSRAVLFRHPKYTKSV